MTTWVNMQELEMYVSEPQLNHTHFVLCLISCLYIISQENDIVGGGMNTLEVSLAVGNQC